MMRLVFVIVVILGAPFSAADPAHAQDNRRVGVLTCRLSPSVGLIIGSRQRMDCRFNPRQGGAPERYFGSVTRFGLDLGITVGGVMTWAVLARTSRLGRGALAGNFVGASGDIGLGVGVGANVLIGGSRRTTMLQPLSVSGQVGINLAVGVAGLTLRFRG
jgi:Protein of unknown function (DUF992)